MLYNSTVACVRQTAKVKSHQEQHYVKRLRRDGALILPISVYVANLLNLFGSIRLNVQLPTPAYVIRGCSFITLDNFRHFRLYETKI